MSPRTTAATTLAPDATVGVTGGGVVGVSRLTRGERIFAVAGAGLFVLAWFDLWASISAEAIGFERNGDAWQSYGALGKLMILVTLAGLVLLALRATDKNFKVARVSYAVLGVAATSLMILMLFVGPDDEGLGTLPSVDSSRGILLFVGIVLGVAMTYGGYLHPKQQQAPEPAPGGPASPSPPVLP